MVSARNNPTLQGPIEKHVAQSTTIKTDEWKAYKGLDKIGFNHLSVNHSINFVDENGTHTQLIESLWSQIKGTLKTKRGTRREDLAGYLDIYSFNSEGKYLNIEVIELFFRNVVKVDLFY